MAQFYILSVYQQAESFLESFRDEHPTSKQWRYSSSEPLLLNILKNIGKELETNLIQVGKYRFEVFDYYRLVRNRFMHAEIDEKRLNKRFAEVRLFSQEIQREYRISSVPKRYEEISFDDFLLFSRVTKDIALALCEIGRPNNPELVEMVLEFSKQEKHGLRLSSLMKLKNNPSRLNNALYNVVQRLYRLGKTEAQSVVEGLSARLRN